MIVSLLVLGCDHGKPSPGIDAMAPGCPPDEVAPTEERTISCDGGALTLPEVTECTLIDRYIVDVIVANAALFQGLSARQAIQRYDRCVGSGE
jgi:hypothetical protein